MSTANPTFDPNPKTLIFWAFAQTVICYKSQKDVNVLQMMQSFNDVTDFVGRCHW